MRFLPFVIISCFMFFLISCQKSDLEVSLTPKIFNVTDGDEVKFALKISSKENLQLKLHEENRENIMLTSLNDFCGKRQFIVTKRRSRVLSRFMRRGSSEVIEVSGVVKKDPSEGLWVADFGAYGKICAPKESKKIDVGVTFYQAMDGGAYLLDESGIYAGNLTINLNDGYQSGE